jgi:hypothetical protein
MIYIFNLLAVVSALVAAFYWYMSSRVLMPSELVGGALIGGLVYVNTTPLVVAAKESGRLNAIAAFWSAAAAIFVAAAVVCDACVHIV